MIGLGSDTNIKIPKGNTQNLPQPHIPPDWPRSLEFESFLSPVLQTYWQKKMNTASRKLIATIRKSCWLSGKSPKNWLSIDIWRSRNVLNTKERAKQQFGILENVKRRKGLVGGSYLKSGTGNGKAVIRVKCSFLQRFHSFWPPFFWN